MATVNHALRAESLDSLILHDLNSLLNTIRKDRSYDRKDYRRLRFLKRNFAAACPLSKYWAAKQLALYQAGQDTPH